MDSPNPYAPPSVDRTIARENETLFEYKSTSRNPFFVITSLPIIFATVVVISQLLKQSLLSPAGVAAANRHELIAASIAAALLLSFSLFFIAGLIVPRVWSFCVDREFVTWRTPWPRSTEMRVPVTAISRVEFQGPTISILTEGGRPHVPLQYTYGGQTDEVVEAIKDAVLERDPTIRIHQHGQIDDRSLMRRFGRLVGGALRWNRGR
jgi:hypothetical protein